jgi:hypothetical protein
MTSRTARSVLSWTGLALLLCLTPPSSSQAAPPAPRVALDLATALIGKGYASATYSCRDGSSLTVRYEVRADLGPSVVATLDSGAPQTLARYLGPVDSEISGCTLGKDFQGNGAVLCYSAPGSSPATLETIDLGIFQGRAFQSVSHCFVKSVKRTRE